MKYMTPELLARFRSPDDAVADEADTEWERRCQEYAKHLKEIRKDLTPGGRLLLLRYDFHDAKVLTMAADEVRHFSFFLELDNPGGPSGKRYLEIRYQMVPKGFTLTKHEALAGDGKPFGWWLYDELDVVAGEVPAMSHAILLTGGYEIRLVFYGVSVRRLDFLSLAIDDEGVVDPKIGGQWKPLLDAINS